MGGAGLLHSLPRLSGPDPVRSGVFFELRGPCNDTMVCEDGNRAQARLWVKLSVVQASRGRRRIGDLALFGTTGLESARYWILVCVLVCVSAAQQQSAATLLRDDR